MPSREPFCLRRIRYISGKVPSMLTCCAPAQTSFLPNSPGRKGNINEIWICQREPSWQELLSGVDVAGSAQTLKWAALLSRMYPQLWENGRENGSSCNVMGRG